MSHLDLLGLSAAVEGASGASTRRARRVKPGDGDADPDLDRDVVALALSGATSALKQAAASPVAAAGALASQFLPAALRGATADDALQRRDGGTASGRGRSSGASPRQAQRVNDEDSRSPSAESAHRSRSPRWSGGASPGLRLGALGPFDREELAGASTAPSARLLAVATERGYGRDIAENAARRIADAFGVPAGALEPADCADLLLQALREEHAQPGLQFVRPARPLRHRFGALGGMARRMRVRAALLLAALASRGGRIFRRRAQLPRRSHVKLRSGAFTGDDGGGCGAGALATFAFLALLAGLAVAAAAGGGGAWAAAHVSRRVAQSPTWAVASRCALYDAAAAGDVAAAKVYLRTRGADRYGDASQTAAASAAGCGAARGPRGLAAAASALGAAVAGGHVAVAGALLDAGAPPDSGWRVGPAWAPLLTLSPLAVLAAAPQAPQPLLGTLLRRGARPDQGVRMGFLAEITPLALALASGNAPAAQALAAGGADPALCARLLWLWAPCDDVAAVAASSGTHASAETATRAMRTAGRVRAQAEEARAARRGDADAAAEAAAEAHVAAAAAREAAQADAGAAREVAARRREARRAESAATADDMLRSADRAAADAAARAAEAERAEAEAVRAAAAAARAAAEAAEL